MSRSRQSPINFMAKRGLATSSRHVEARLVACLTPHPVLATTSGPFTYTSKAVTAT